MQNMAATKNKNRTWNLAELFSSFCGKRWEERETGIDNKFTGMVIFRKEERIKQRRQQKDENHVTACVSRRHAKLLASEDGWVTFGQFSADFLRQSFSINRNKTS